MRQIFTILCFLLLAQAQATVRRVKPGGLANGPGSSWSNAYADVQAAINASTYGDQVWIAAGSYYRSSGQSYIMKDGVKIYGGFSGTNDAETVDSRNWQANITGLVGNNASVIDNSTVTLSAAALLDGVTITGGRANSGAGMNNGLSGAPSIANVTFDGNIATSTSGSGGAIWTANVTFSVTNCIFRNNQAALGAGIYNDEAYPVVKNCVFANNTATTDGGGVFNFTGQQQVNTKKPTFINVVFYNNKASNRSGGGISNWQSSPIITNCTFVSNSSGGVAGGGVHSYDDPGTTTPISNPVITNCVFWKNTSTNGTALVDIGTLRATSTVSYSYFRETSTYSNSTNITTGATSPFVNENDPDGADNKWMTSDDGLMLTLCSGLIDIGDNNAISEPLDLNKQPRKFDNKLIAATGNGTFPYVDFGSYEDQTPTTPVQVAGSIGNGHTVPNPQELVSDIITSTANAVSGTISWQKSTDGGANWVAATPAGNQQTYTIPALTQTTLFRRGITTTAAYCNATYYTDPVTIKVIIPNGSIEGRVTSRSGNGVEGIVIKIQRLTPNISGTPDNYTYYDTTNSVGNYQITRIYYGDQTRTDTNISANFRITPVKANHGFSPSSVDVSLSNTNSNTTSQTVNFTDTTTFSVFGRTSQVCASCNDENGNPTSLTCPIDSVNIWSKLGSGLLSLSTQSGFINPSFGRYNLSITSPDTIRIEPRLTGRVFSPAFKSFRVTQDTAEVNFNDITTRTVSGKLTAGCGNYVGTANLEFYDVLPNDQNGNPRSSCFRKRVTTSTGSGTFSVSLPARKYRVRVISFSPIDGSTDLMPTNVMNFFNNQVSPDSLTFDLSNQDAVLNLTLQRYPVISLLSGLDTLCNGTNRGFALMQQGITDSFKLKVFQGPASVGCVLTDTTTKLKVFTNIPLNDSSSAVELRYNSQQQGITVRLKGGVPNIIAPYYKTLNIQFEDKYGNRAAQINKNVVVTGVKADTATFTTVSPQIPMLVLHDPPGDNSFSTWQKDSTSQTALRLYAGTNNSTDIWSEVKIGAQFEAGVGVTTESEVWGTINGAVNVNSSNTTGNETILTTTASQSFSTSSATSVTGADGDLYIGAALNLLYAGSTEISYNNCQVKSGRKLIVANNGFSTQYVYTEKFIKSTLIPNLILIAQSQPTTARRDSFMNQVSVWQQVLNNNAANKARASFDKNISFDGSAGPITNQTSSSVAATNTIEFNMNINSTLASQLGFEVAGSGASGGITVAFKTETGTSSSTNITKQTTIGYTLDDKDDGDYFSVNIKKDPVYSTPVFELAAATASCPPEPGAQPRDEMQLTIPTPSVSGVPETGFAEFVFKLGNTSQSGETRTYNLALDNASNPYGAIVTIGGNPANVAYSYSIDYLQEKQVTVRVQKASSSNVYSYEGLRFVLSDNCTGDVKRYATISAYFVNQCSNVTLAAPENNWTLNAAANNILPVLIRDYNVAGLTSVTLEYAKAGSSNWAEGFTRSAAQLNPVGSNGTQVNWNVASLTDTLYNLRLRLNCTQGVVYSQRASGTIDRKAPELFGRPTPTNDTYRNGDVISFSYNEALAVNNLNNGQVTMRRLSNNQLIPVSVSGYGNKIIITPVNSITSLTGDSIRVVVTNMADVYGNTKATPDTLRFVVGNSVAGTGPNALNVSILNPMMSNIDNGTIDIRFTLPQPAAYDRRVYYTVSGTAQLHSEYDTILPTTNRNVNMFNGAQGVIVIPKNATVAVLKIDPIFRNTPGPDKTITISLAEGGDYTIGANSIVTGTITYATILPLKLISFTGRLAGEAAELQWQTSNEINTATFTVEKSADGNTFAPLTTVAAKGSGNNQYAATDANPFVGKSYYRLRMTDKDGKEAYSQVIVVSVAPKALQLISLSPSPLQGTLGKLSLVAAKASKLQLIVVDFAGRQIAVQPITALAGTNSIAIDLPQLQPGMYTLYAIDGTNKSNTIRFVKQ